jgi:diguanylate cyclase (GGDEF)-like protein/PAS domain S-box-containing protein
MASRPDVIINDPLSESPAGGALELVARVAAMLLDAPIAVVSLVTAQGWRNVGIGLNGGWAVRELPDAATALTATGLYVRCYSPGQHPISGVRTFAAMALPREPGRQGIIAVLDRKPREFSDADHSTLDGLRLVVAGALRIDASESPAAAPRAVEFTLDLSGRFIGVKGGAGEIGYSAPELLGSNIYDLVTSTYKAQARERLIAQVGTGSSNSFELELVAKSGRPLLLSFRTRLLFDHGRPVGIQAVCRDVSSIESQREMRHEAEAVVHAKTEELARFSENLRELQRLNLARHETAGELCLDYVAAGCAMFGVRSGRITDAKGATLASIPANLVSAKAPALSAEISYGGTSFGTLSFGADEPRLFISRQNRDLLELMAQTIGHAMFSGRLEQERDRLNKQLERQLRRDALTGLPNRLALFEWMEEAISAAAGKQQRLAMLFIDLDRFKQINDSLGHAAGDDLLQQVAERLMHYTRTQDMAARAGGDEFAFIFANAPEDDDIAVHIRTLLDGLRASYLVNGYELFVTASVGVAVYPRDGADTKTLLQRADAAMYHAKSHGKNDFQFFSPALIVRTMNRLELETQLRRAIENGELETRFQPIFDLDGRIDGLEALLAWNSRKLGNIGPARFIPIAEESGMIVSIGIWALRHACKQNAAWQADGYAPLRISVNVSALQFARADFVELVAAALQESGMPPQCLDLELTESLVMRDVDESVRRMARLRELGVSMSIDDFGTGHSSLSYLRRLPVDSLKIDRSFLSDLTTSMSSLPLIQTIVVLAHNMGLSVVAEGVETEEQLAILRAIGCDRVQGHLFGEPLRAGGVPAILPRRN